MIVEGIRKTKKIERKKITIGKIKKRKGMENMTEIIRATEREIMKTILREMKEKKKIKKRKNMAKEVIVVLRREVRNTAAKATDNLTNTTKRIKENNSLKKKIRTINLFKRKKNEIKMKNRIKMYKK